MPEKENQAVEPREAPPKTPPKNPYILNFCKVLVERKGEKLEPEPLKKLLNDMYRLFENMLGQRMIDALPEDLRKQYLEMTEDLSRLSYDKIGEIFDPNIPNYEAIMKATMKEFADIFMKNRTFNPEDYPAPFEPVST